MNTLDIMNWARERTCSLPIALVIYAACLKLSPNKDYVRGAMDSLFHNPSEDEFNLVTKMAFALPEASGLDHMFWGDNKVTR